MEVQGTVEGLTSERAGHARCSGCDFLAASSRCEIRQAHVPAPSETLCANHQDLDPKGRRLPVGPMFVLRGRDLRLFAESPDEEKLRRNLIDLLAGIEAVSAEELSFKEQVTIWQARRFGDRRAYVHLDRLESNMLAAKSPAVSGPVSGLHSVATRAGLVDHLGRLDPSRISLAGRLLILSALVVLGLGFWGEFQLWAWLQQGQERTILPMMPVVSALATWAYVRVGLVAFRKLGIPFRAENAVEDVDAQ